MFSKYRAKKTEIDGVIFASKAEAKRYQQLKFLLGAKAIYDLKLQPRFTLEVNNTKICTYVPDFQYKDQKGMIWVEDVKGYPTRDYKIKAKLFQALYPNLQFREVKA